MDQCRVWHQDRLIARTSCFSTHFLKSEAKKVKTVPSPLRQSLELHYWRPCQREVCHHLLHFSDVCMRMQHYLWSNGKSVFGAQDLTTYLFKFQTLLRRMDFLWCTHRHPSMAASTSWSVVLSTTALVLHSKVWFLVMHRGIWLR